MSFFELLKGLKKDLRGEEEDEKRKSLTIKKKKKKIFKLINYEKH